MKKVRVAYYIVTVIFSLGILAGAIVDVTGNPGAKEMMMHLGYPVYVMYIVGWAKILGIIGIWQNKSATLREWAYAGLTFDLVGALISHLAVGDGPQGFMPALVGLLLCSASYALFKKKQQTATVENKV